MAQNFIACDRDQVLLLPPDLRDWLPEDHLARFVIETVGQLDLDGVYGYYRQDGRGRPAHDPAMMVALLLYAYSVGVTSSRRIERECVDDVAFRVISCNEQPDHSTVARFLVRHRDEVKGLFSQVLGLCAQAGMVRVGVVAVDSTKLAANASAGQNRTFEGLEAEAARIIEDAVETDRREDELYGGKRGDELPGELADPRTRKARIRELLEQARREREAVEAERERKIAAHQPDPVTGKRIGGRPPRPQGGRREQALFSKKYNVTDPDSCVVRHRGMLMQGYNVQLAASEDQVILAASATGAANDHGQLEPILGLAERALAELGIDQPQQVLADSGYWHIGQVQSLRQRGIRALVPPTEQSRTGQHTSPETVRMRAELTEPETARLYGRRKQIVEPVFAQTKHHRQITRVLRRGRQAVQAEIDLIATTHNLLKLRTALRAA